MSFFKKLFSKNYICQCCGCSVSTRYETLCDKCEKELRR